MPSSNGNGVSVPVIETKELWRVYRLGDQEIPALRGVNLTINPGSYIALKGRSGSGKTTLLNCLGGLDRPTKGTVRVSGQEIGTWNERQLTLATPSGRLHLPVVGLVAYSSAYENVELMLRMIGADPKERRICTLECLELVGLTKWADHRPYEMSGGKAASRRGAGFGQQSARSWRTSRPGSWIARLAAKCSPFRQYRARNRI